MRTWLIVGVIVVVVAIVAAANQNHPFAIGGTLGIGVVVLGIALFGLRLRGDTEEVGTIKEAIRKRRTQDEARERIALWENAWKPLHNELNQVIDSHGGVTKAESVWTSVDEFSRNHSPQGIRVPMESYVGLKKLVAETQNRVRRRELVTLSTQIRNEIKSGIVDFDPEGLGLSIAAELEKPTDERVVFDQGGVVVTATLVNARGRTFPLSGEGVLHKLFEYHGRWKAGAVVGFGAFVVLLGLFPPTPVFVLTGIAIIAAGAWWFNRFTPTFRIIWRTYSSEGHLLSSSNERWIDDIMSAVRSVRPEKVSRGDV